MCARPEKKENMVIGRIHPTFWGLAEFCFSFFNCRAVKDVLKSSSFLLKLGKRKFHSKNSFPLHIVRLFPMAEDTAKSPQLFVQIQEDGRGGFQKSE